MRDHTYMSYGLQWANASNTPFVLYKHWVHEGGIATPFVARWPGVIPPGGLDHTPVHFIDLMATCLDVSGTPYPETYEGKSITPTEGRSILPVLTGETPMPERPLFWEHEGNRAVRRGKWKLVCQADSDWELYDMETDRTEQENLAERFPDRVRELSAEYEAWAGRAGVLSWESEVLPAVIKQGTYGKFLHERKG